MKLRIIIREKDRKAFALMVCAAGALLFHTGGSCGSKSHEINCCTQGDPATAYMTAFSTCPQGFQWIGYADQANHPRLYATCQVSGRKGGPAAVSPPNLSRTPDVGSSSAASRQSMEGLASSNAPTPRSCFSECPPGAQGPNCVMGAIPSAAAAGLARFASNLAAQRTFRFEPWPLMQAFQLAGDPCQRGATILEGGRIRNSGEHCVVTVPAPAMRLQLQFEVPESLDAIVTRRGDLVGLRAASAGSGGSVRLFQTGSSAPHALDSRMGGRVLELESNGSFVFLRTRGGCLGAPLPAAPSQ